MLAGVRCQNFLFSTRPAQPAMAFGGLSTLHPTIVKGPTWPSSSVEYQNLVRPKHVNAKRLFPFSQTSHQPFRLSSVVGQPGPVEKAQHAMPIIPCQPAKMAFLFFSFTLLHRPKPLSLIACRHRTQMLYFLSWMDAHPGSWLSPR